MENILIKDENYFYGQIPIEMEVSPEEYSKILKEYPAPTFQKNDDDFRIAACLNKDELKEEVMLMHSCQLEVAGNGNPFLKLVFGNSSGVIGGKIWSNVEQMQESFEKHSIFKVSGVIEQFPAVTGPKTIKISKAIPVLDEIDPISLLPAPDFDVEKLVVELFMYIEELSQPHKRIALNAMRTYWAEFSTKPAAKRHHHAYMSGLLKHTVGLMRIIKFIRNSEDTPYKAMIKLITTIERKHSAEMFSNLSKDEPLNMKKMPWNDTIDHIKGLFGKIVGMKDQDIDFDLLLTSALLHDIGKIFELSQAGEKEKFKILFPFLKRENKNPKKTTGLDMDEHGKMVGHIAYGVFVFKDIVEKNEIEIGLEDFHRYLHNILCHHGKIEWGMPVHAQTPDAVLLHFVDFLDSRWELVEQQNKKTKGEK